MATKQWIGIEEAATKYQVSTRRIITWCERQEIIYSEIGDYLMLDENSLTDCLERNIRFSLSEEEHKRRMDEKMKEMKRNFSTSITERVNPIDPVNNKGACRNDKE